MTDTTATTGTSADEADTKPVGDHAPSGAAHRPDGAGTPNGPAESEAGVDPQAVGRAAVRSDSDSSESATTTFSVERPTFTRPPGMPPPPVQIEDGAGADANRRVATGVAVPVGGIRVSPSGAYPVVSGSAPVSAPPRGTGKPGTSGVTVRPISPGAAVGAARVSDAVRATRSAPAPRGPRRARLGVKRIDPWSVMKFSFAVSLVLFIVMIVAASVLYLALDTMGVFASVNSTLADLMETTGGSGAFQITARGVIGTAAVLGAINVVLFTALATLGAFVYNVCADLVGGIELTLAERD